MDKPYRQRKLDRVISPSKAKLKEQEKRRENKNSIAPCDRRQGLRGVSVEFTWDMTRGDKLF